MPQLDSLGLKEHPFKNSTDQRYFFSDQNRAQILESTEHLIEFSNNVQVIVGAAGVGKSHLLEALSNRIDNNWRIAKIKDAGQYDTLSLIQAILTSLDVVSDDEMDLLETLETQLAEIIQLGFKPVLFIDNADALSVDSIRFLLQLSQQEQNDEPYINIVLFATTQITEHLQDPELRDFRDIIHIVTLANLDKEGVSGYLRHKMAVAGFDRESPFTPRIVDSIYKDSNGVPEKINFFASKFLASSGKGDNYILPDAGSPEPNINSPEPQINSHNDDMASVPENDLVSALKENEFQDDRTDRVEEQINRLAEKFAEIEKMGEQPADAFLNDKELYDKELNDQESIDKEQAEDDFPDVLSDSPFEDEEVKPLGLPKFIIPIALIGIILAALLVINTVFNPSEQTAEEQVSNKDIELLPLELPAEGSFSAQDPSQLQETKAQRTELDTIDQTSQPDAQKVTELELVEAGGSEVKKIESELPASTEQIESVVAEQISTEAIAVSESNVEAEAAAAAPAAHISAPELRTVEPEPVIGSAHRQYITITGSNLEKNSTMVISWGDNKKEFSQQLTPEQWVYQNKSKIKLHLATGIESQQWHVYARSIDGRQSKTITFDVVKPFISGLSIQKILPNPLIGSNKRQTVSIIGQGFSRQTVIELKWANNKKQFSSRLTPTQFEFVSAKHLKLFVTTGKKERQWGVVITNPGSGKTSSATFAVVSKNHKVKAATAEPLPDNIKLKDKSWLQQQHNTRFTIQLLGSNNTQSIDQLIRKYSLKGDIAVFETRRNGQNWYSMTYGNYVSKQEAITAIALLNPELTVSTPWVRSFESIKKQVHQSSATVAETKVDKNRADKKISAQTSITAELSQSGKIRDEAWIWTQNPADFTVQILALSTEPAIQHFIKKQKISSEAIYFKIKRNGQPLYVLIYGVYSDKKSAQKAKEQLAAKITGSKPWVRSYSEVHGLMSKQ